MDQNDLGRAFAAGVHLGRSAVGAGLSIALLPLRLVKHAILPSPSEPDTARWQPPAGIIHEQAGRTYDVWRLEDDD